MINDKILFDLTVCQPIGTSKFHGGGVYGFIVFKKMCEYDPTRLIAYYDKTRFLDPEVLEAISANNVSIIDSSNVKLSDALDRGVSLFYSPLYDSSYECLYGRDVKVFITIHGLRKLEMNRDSYESLYAPNFAQYLKCLLKRTPLYNMIWRKFYKEYETLMRQENVSIITVSNHSKSSLQFYYPTLPSENIKVYYSPSTTPENYTEIKPYSDEKYYLIVSADRWLKNAFRAMKALDELFERYPSLVGKVCVLGMNGSNKLIKKLKNKNRFNFMGYVSKDSLESLLKGAYLLIYPSLNEGFGYPPLEAMKYGTPVVSSPFSSITEVCGDSVLYANPYDPNEIAMRVLQMEDKSFYDIYVEKAIQRYSYISKKQDTDLGCLVETLFNSAL